MQPRLLLTTTYAPVQRILDFAATDQMGYRLTRGQELFTPYLHTHSSSLHLLAQNVEEPSVLLENPTLDDLSRELDNGYDYVGISFDPINAERMLEMATVIRRCSPKTKIIVGGYGAICGSELAKDDRWTSLIDHVAHGEGIGFLRNIMGAPPATHIHTRLPKEGATLPWLSPRPIGTVGIILSGLGCTQRCPFCVTSASSQGAYVELMDAGAIARTMRNYWEKTPATDSVTIYDENFLDHFDKVRALGSLLQADPDFGMRKYGFSAFGSLKALSRFDPEELLLTGLDKAWVGVESKFFSHGKTREKGASEIFPWLHSIGIKTIGSWILGQDFQTPDNLAEDLDYFVELDSTFQQLSLLTVVPGTALWRAYKRQGKVPANVPWGEYHLYGESFINQHFSHSEMLAILARAYDRIYHERGPALMKAIEVNLNGYDFTRQARHPLLRKERSLYFRDRARSYLPLLRTARELAPSPLVASRLDDIRRRSVDAFGAADAREQVLSESILRRAMEEVERRSRNVGAARQREEPFRRYTYPAMELRQAARPYNVEYPRGYGSEAAVNKPSSQPLRRRRLGREAPHEGEQKHAVAPTRS